MTTSQRNRMIASDEGVNEYEPIGLSLRYPQEDANVSIGISVKRLNRAEESTEDRSARRPKRKEKEILDVVKKDPYLRRAIDILQINWLGAGNRLNDTNSEYDLLDPDVILDQLQMTHGEERRSLICEAELTCFTAEQRQRLLPILWRFILDHHNSDEHDDLITVGSAIRKYVAMMEVTQIGCLSTLLELRNQVPLPVDLELEVVKMVYRKFEANPPTRPEPEPALAEQVAKIARLYLDSRLILRKFYGTAAMLSLQALAVMLSHRWAEVIPQVNTLPYEGFRSQLRRRLSSTVELWRERDVSAAGSLSLLLADIVAW